ncbi:MAG: hypothetical protein JXO72_04885 [Vicinamibacteria bacterium]|nr:hypothetical protein [Vicinamibacteria bacterium]
MTRVSRFIVLTATLAVLSSGVATAQDREGTITDDGGGNAAVNAARPRFGVGWDDGIAFRARLGSRWGLGLRVNPDITDSEANASSSFMSHHESDGGPIVTRVPGTSTVSPLSESMSESESIRNENMRTFGVSAMLYYERGFGRRLAAGPYLGLNYTRLSCDTTTSTHNASSSSYVHPEASPFPGDLYESWGEAVTERWERNVGVELGVRPILRFGDHFILETRLGLEMLFTKWNEKSEDSDQSTSGNDSGVRLIPLDVAPRRGTTTRNADNEGSSTRFHAVGDRVLSDFQIRMIVFF